MVPEAMQCSARHPGYCRARCLEDISDYPLANSPYVCTLTCCDEFVQVAVSSAVVAVCSRRFHVNDLFDDWLVEA